MQHWELRSIVVPGLSSSSSGSSSTSQTPLKQESYSSLSSIISSSSNPLFSEIPEWLQEFKEILVDDEIPLQGGSHASSSHEVPLEPFTKRREDLGKHNVHTHFTKNKNYEISKRTKITRAPYRRRHGEAVLWAANFGVLVRADHKVLSDNCESRNNHRCAVAVQDLATQNPGISPKLHKNPREGCISSWNPRGNQKSFTLTIPWN